VKVTQKLVTWLVFGGTGTDPVTKGKMDSLTFLQWANVGQSVFVFALGAIFASFWALVAFRVTRHRGWVRGRSECDFCHHQISWWENIPVLSYLLLRGRCRHCRAKIRVSYFLWEVLLGLWAVFWLWQLSPFAPYLDATNFAELVPFWQVPGQLFAVSLSLLVLMLGAVLLWTALIDILTHEIADGWLWVLAGLTLAKLGLYFGYGSLTLAMLGKCLLSSLAIGLIFWLIDQAARRIWRRTGIGLGDTYMVMILAWWLSPGQLLVMFLLAFWLGAIVGVLQIVFLWLAGLERRDLTVAFLPFINIAFLVSYVYGRGIFGWLFGG